MTKMTLIRIVMALLVLLLFGWFVWPTIYRYDHMTIGSNTLLVRTHRLTGKSAILFITGGWQEAPDKGNLPSRLPKEAVEKIQFIFNRARFPINLDTDGVKIESDVQNGSDWILDSLTMNVTVLDGSGDVVIKDRQYVLTRQAGTGVPNTNSNFADIDLGNEESVPVPQRGSWTATLVAATGTKVSKN